MNLNYNKKKVCGNRDHSIVIISCFYKGLGGMNFYLDILLFLWYNVIGNGKST